MNPPKSFLWHDYETFGTHPALDRPSQFAAIRTNADLEPLGESVTWYCKPAVDNLPQPMACLITGITPQEADQKGVVEAEFARLIHGEMMEPGTCGVGYNSIRFDDEFSRHIFYRNFYDPYEREWRNGNSRWDLIDLVRMFYALRPAGIKWPNREDGKPSFKLEHLTAANDISHEGAHDALSDVHATIDLARLLKQANARLFGWALGLRDKKAVLGMLDTVNPTPLLHTTMRIPADRGCTSLVLPLATQPDRPNSIVLIDLMADPEPLLSLDADDIADRVFTSSADLPEGVERVPLKTIAANKSPMIAPASVLRGVDLDRIGLDPERCARHADTIRAHLHDVRGKVMEVFAPRHGDPGDDPDTMLYSGGFFPDSDRAAMTKIRATDPADLGTYPWRFEDPRLESMLFRYRARNYPDTLTPEEWADWETDRWQRIENPASDRQMGLGEFRQALAEARLQNKEKGPENALLDAVEDWVNGLRPAGMNTHGTERDDGEPLTSEPLF